MKRINKKVRVLGKDFITTVLVVRKRKIKHHGREYFNYYIDVPKELGEELEKETNTELNEIPILALLRPAEWYYLLDWNQVRRYIRENLKEEIKKELKELGFIDDQ